jgi:High-affinity nickel-transport protein
MLAGEAGPVPTSSSVEPVRGVERITRMFGLDDTIVHLSTGGSIGVVLLVAVLLGLRHATDPDHIAALSTLIVGEERVTRAAARLGAFWGLGHALTLIVFGVPILLSDRFLPERAQRGAETAVAALIVFLAVRVLVRWRHGAFQRTAPTHHDGDHRHPVRTPLGAFGIGLVHGMGGSAGVGVLLLAAIPSTPIALVSLVVLAFFTAVSMTVVTTGFGATFAWAPVAGAIDGAAPAFGVASLAFGLWYALAAWGAMPYPF